MASDLADAFRRDGYVVIAGAVDGEALAAIGTAMEGLQVGLVDGSLDRQRHGGDVYTAAVAGSVATHPHYVLDVTRLSPEVDAAFHEPSMSS